MQSYKNQCKFEQIRVDACWKGPGWEERAMPSFWCKTISGVVLPRHLLIPVMLENAEATERNETLMSCSLLLPWKRIISSALWVLPPHRCPYTHTQWARVVHMAVGGWMDLPCRKVWFRCFLSWVCWNQPALQFHMGSPFTSAGALTRVLWCSGCVGMVLTWRWCPHPMGYCSEHGRPRMYIDQK